MSFFTMLETEIDGQNHQKCSKSRTGLAGAPPRDSSHKSSPNRVNIPDFWEPCDGSGPFPGLLMNNNVPTNIERL